MAAELLKFDGDLTLLNRKDIQNLKQKVDENCRGKHGAFFRIQNSVITFMYGKVRCRIDVNVSNDHGARRQMGLTESDRILYAHLQTGSGQTVANIIYPQDSTKVQLNTLIAALKGSLERRSTYTAIN